MSSYQYRFGQFCFDPTQQVLTRKGVVVQTRHKLLQLLAFFLEHPGEVVSKDTLLQAVWDQGEFRERALSQTILELRKLLGDSASHPSFIRTVPNKGYQWIAETEQAVIKRKSSRSFKYFALVLSLAITLVITWLLIPSKTQKFANDSLLRIAIAPFENATAQTSLQWVRYGLSDMLATDLMLYPNVEVMTPAQMDWRGFEPGTDAADWLQRHDLDLLIMGEVSLLESEYQLAYTLIDERGKQEQGNIVEPDLAVSMPIIAAALHQQIRPQFQTAPVAPYPFEVNAMHEYAKGQHAMTMRGCKLAQHYFAASVVIDDKHEWSELQHAICQFELGDKQAAKVLLESILTASNDAVVHTLAHLWLSEIEIRLGDVSQATYHFEASGYPDSVRSNQQWLAYGGEIAATLQSMGALTLENPSGSSVIRLLTRSPLREYAGQAELNSVRESHQYPMLVAELRRYAHAMHHSSAQRVDLLREALRFNQWVESYRLEGMLRFELIYWLIDANQTMDAEEELQTLRKMVSQRQDAVMMGQINFLEAYLAFKQTLQGEEAIERRVFLKDDSLYSNVAQLLDIWRLILAEEVVSPSAVMETTPAMMSEQVKEWQRQTARYQLKSEGELPWVAWQ
ncbi:winged helix-turn-helix domain-containing protein [Thaumasiovibrio subtropicus]|uniref:winged helix-turn-helix domain-containing protein n=1 Tax=Thaumasiovibrio subtropicus TaxID=1891207 RepID=UPI00131CEB05|nr:transcriptional regulator [Thaumasiovibrio subtropicus]